MSINVPFKDEFDRLLCCINEAGCSEYVMIIGSWAEYLYDTNGLFEGFVPTMKTQDVDVLIKNLRLPKAKSNLITIATEKGFLYRIAGADTCMILSRRLMFLWSKRL